MVNDNFIPTFLDFHLLNEAANQPGLDFELAFVKQIRKILRQRAGKPFKLVLPKGTYTVIGIKDPAGASTIKADLKIITKEKPGELLVSLKQFPFPAYAGIAAQSRPYLKALSNHPTIQKYIEKLKLYLLHNNSCVLNPKTLPNHASKEKVWLQQNKNRIAKPSRNEEKNKAMLSSLTCSRNYREYYYTPETDESFNNLVVFGHPNFKKEYDYVDYIFKGPKGTVDPFEETKPGIYQLKSTIDVISYGDPIPEDLKPTFLSRTMNPNSKGHARHSYKILNTRTQIVPKSQAEKRNKATAVELK